MVELAFLSFSLDRSTSFVSMQRRRRMSGHAPHQEQSACSNVKVFVIGARPLR
jgi:hypothetical protein